MKLTERAKQDFEKWFIPYIRKQRGDYYQYDDNTLILKFYREIFSMQFGVYVDFFDSVSLRVTIEDFYGSLQYNIYFKDTVYSSSIIHPLAIRDFVRTEAIKKANESYNKNKES